MNEDHAARRAGLLSQQLVMEGKRDAWLDLFADDALIQDPVGVFYDTVIAGGDTRFIVEKSYAAGDECAFVGRILNKRPGLPETEVELVAVYRVREDGKILSLRAFWEFEALLQKTQSS